ncbi:MAG: methyltransferase, partial [Gammaproteobacteria bacterium]|nr:methyltransferase [Gammaproteobacteria bacterium]
LFDASIVPHESIYPICYKLENLPYVMVNHASVFSRDKLDIGTRFFLQQIPAEGIYGDIIDLGCGNGVAGLVAAELNQNARIVFYDESYMAVASAQESYERSGLLNRTRFRVGDCLDGYSDQSADLILCNPPFHQQQVVGDYVAMRMFKQSRRALKPGCKLLVIGNRHLGYHIKLKRLFNQVETIASNSKFVVLSAHY